MNKEDVRNYILSKSESGKDGMTVVKLGYVYKLIDDLFRQQEKYAELGRLFAKCSVECGKENCRIDICDISKVCQKRAELMVEGRE